MADNLSSQMKKLADAKAKFCQKCGCATRPLRDGVFKCPRCGTEYLSDFGKIRKFLDDMGPSTIRQISLATGVPAATISAYLDDSKVEIAESSLVFLQCERCGIALKSGKICYACSQTIDRAAASQKERDLLNSVGDVPRVATEGGKMHYMKKRKTVSMSPTKVSLGSRLVIDLKEKKEKEKDGDSSS
ncbi:MAG: hypothetical protein K6G16_06680 [Lachnospiraceae bacterium]|nr:hypothetical protein [Lachnospiraceae bacterium]